MDWKGRTPIVTGSPANFSFTLFRRIKSFSDPEKRRGRKESIADQTVMQFNWHDPGKGRDGRVLCVLWYV